ncbi:hypothetical protein CBW65_23185 [Tumebacillus avium]|uniref:Uncharacterized protein n=1 Tax=Tumebacillus avium TaxID=1903704 RepID=A0A1Y0ISU3_9BACL|nr:hypothetical protein [Tumebacillus avium]ARU63591.1 hypothetical protein CBW65_23185 [Tumebacillus avium]
MNKQKVKITVIAGVLIAVLTAGWYLFFPSQTSPEDTALVMPAVEEYFSVRKQAILSGNVSALHKRYPELAKGTDLRAGINSEALMVEQHRSPKTFDETLDLEYYEPIQVQLRSDTAKVVVHGLSGYLHPEDIISEGEFHLTLTLRQQSGVWTVTQTDEKTLEEYHTEH